MRPGIEYNEQFLQLSLNGQSNKRVIDECAQRRHINQSVG
jgi:hypothetical protein